MNVKTQSSRRPHAPVFSTLLAGALLISTSAASAGPVKTFSSASARDFLPGDSDGIVLSASGKLMVGPRAEVRDWPADAADAVIFASAATRDGKIYLATGGGAGRLYAGEPGGKVRLLFEADEPNLTAVAVGPDGAIVCGASPGGAVYKVNPSASDPRKAASLWAETKEAAVWSLLFGSEGSLYIGTGNKGRIFRRDSKGATNLLVELEDTHVRTLAMAPDGAVLAGTSDKGLVVSVGKDGSVRTLHDFSRPEVTGLAVRSDGSIYAAASAIEVPSLAARGTAQPRSPIPSPTPTPSPQDTPKGSVSVSTGPVRLFPSGGAPTTARDSGNSEIVVISPDGGVDPAWGFSEEAIYGISIDPKSGELLIAAGPKGRLYSLTGRELRLLIQSEDRQVVAGYLTPPGPVIVTMSAPGVYRAGKPRQGVFTSPVRDAARLSTVHSLRVEGPIPAGARVQLAARAGNSAKPDKSWGPWVDFPFPPSSPAPAGRYLQWKAVLSVNEKGESPVIERADLAYSERNSRPILENLSILEPNAVFPRGAASSGPAVLSIANPDEQGIFAGVEPPRETSPEPAGKKLYRKGFRTATWKGTDLNGDPLRYDVEITRLATGVTFNLRKDVEEAYLSFDTTAVPDGRYRLRITASDRINQPEGLALTATEESESFIIDNSPPVLKVLESSLREGQLTLTVAAADALSPLLKAEATVNGDRWRHLPGQDGATDSPEEKFTVKVPKPSGPAFVSIRVIDVFGNGAAIAAEYPKDFK